jgi:hypothetical protein
MNRRFVWLSILVACFTLWFVLNGCSFVSSKEEPVDVHNEMAKIANMIFAGASSGDSTEIMEYMEEEEGGKVLKNLLIDDGISPEQITPKCVRYLDMPDFGDDVFHDGDILLLRDWNRFTSNLLDWLIPSLYTHTGVLNQKRYYRWVKAGNNPKDAPCVMSAVLGADNSALTYQTWRDWASTSVVTRMRVHEKYSRYLHANLSKGKKAFKTFYNDPEGSIYGFIAPYQIPNTEKYVLLPVLNNPYWEPSPLLPKEWDRLMYFFGAPPEAYQFSGSRYWHCSKTAWWVYFASGFTKGFYNKWSRYPDLENNDWYFRSGVDVKTFGFYKLYTALLLLDEDIRLQEAQDLAEKSIKGAMRMVAIPDEVRFATTSRFEALFGEAGPLDEDNRMTWGPWGDRSEKLLWLF